MFKVGDRVKRIDGGPDWGAGTVVEVNLNREKEQYIVKWDDYDGTRLTYPASSLIQAPVLRFAVGDRVSHRCGSLTTGYIVGYRENTDYPYVVLWDGGAAPLLFTASELRLIEDDLPSYADGWHDGFKAGVTHAKVEMQHVLDNVIFEKPPKNP